MLGLASARHLDFADGELSDDLELRRELVRVVRTVRPDVVLCPDPTSVFFGDGYVNHRDHRVTGWATLDAISPASGNPHYFRELRAEGLDVHQPRAVYLSGTFEPNVWIDIADTLDRKIEALFCHASQLEDTSDWFRDFLRDTRRGGGPDGGHHVRGGLSPDPVGLTSPGFGSGPGPLAGGYGAGWARHSDWARSIRPATMPAPIAAIAAPATRTAEQCEIARMRLGLVVRARTRAAAQLTVGVSVQLVSTMP